MQKWEFERWAMRPLGRLGKGVAVHRSAAYIELVETRRQKLAARVAGAAR